MGRRKTVSDADLLAAARETFVKLGSAASTREIARRAGVSESVLFQRFTSKAELFFAAMVPPAVDVEAVLAAPRDTGPRERLEEIAIRLMAYFRTLVAVLLPAATHPSFDFENFAHRHPDNPLHRLRAGLTRHFEEERDRGAIVTENPGAAALTLFAALHSLAFFERLGAHGGNFGEAAVRGVVDCLWAGLGPRVGIA